MEQLVSGIMLVTRRKDSRRVIVLSTIFLLFLLLVTESTHTSSTPTTGILILIVLGSLLAGINLSLAYTYMNLHERAPFTFDRKLTPLVSLIKTGGQAYGTAILSVILGFLGFSATLTFLPGEAEEIGYTGLIILLMATYVLARKLERKGVW